MAKGLKKAAKKHSQRLENIFNRQVQRARQRPAIPQPTIQLATEATNNNTTEDVNINVSAANSSNENNASGNDIAGSNINNNITIANENEDCDAADGQKNEYWPPHVINWFQKVKDHIDRSVKYTYSSRGTAKSYFKGSVPREYYSIISPSNDPVKYFANSKTHLTMEQFCLPDLVVWWPEAFYPTICEEAIPECKWHGCRDCVQFDGWMRSPRHAYGKRRVVAILGRVYKCTMRETNHDHPHSFRNIDEAAIAKCDDYIKTQWEKLGFDISHRAAIATDVLELLRSSLNQGLSVSGFRRCLLEDYKRWHFRLSKQWRAYIDSLVRRFKASKELFLTEEMLTEMMRDFVDFDSDLYHQKLPSNAYLIARVVHLMESDAEYKTRRMQMVDGEHLSGDHSFKVAKRVVANGAKAFAAIYSMMNEFGQIPGWWFTSGTGMRELEDCIKKLKQRYKLLGYNGPESFTTDRCCHERNQWNRLLSFADTETVSDDTIGEEDVEEIEVPDLPFTPAPAYNADMALVDIGEISKYLSTQPHESRVVSVDAEWRIGASKADTIAIGLTNGQVYIFSLDVICNSGKRPVPRCIRDFLEDNSIRKVGNRIHNDVNKLKEWDIAMGPVIELGHLTHSRSVSRTKAPSLKDIIGSLWPNVTIEYKDGCGPRVSDWSGNLTQEQIAYAGADAYLEIKAYQRLMQIMDPKAQGRLRINEINEGDRVTVYSQGWKTRVAEGVLCGRGRNSNGLSVCVQLDLNESICVYSPGTYIHPIKSGQPLTQPVTLASLLDDADWPLVQFEWPLYFCRRTLNPSASETPVQLKTRKKQVSVESTDDSDTDDYEADVDEGERLGDGTNTDADSDSACCSDDEINGGTCVAQNVAVAPNIASIRRRRRYSRERVKNDIAHLFFRFERGLSKDHGAYRSFITALRDAIYVVNQEDLDECVHLLKEKYGLSDQQVKEKMRTNFRWFKRRVRRLVPNPRELERRYMSVFKEYRFIVCVKSARTLFGSKNAMKTHRSALKHIRRNCISDIPFVNYYTPDGQDRDGLTRYKCLRGTDGLEGFHQKLRQLMRGFSSSPRLMIALISDFLLRWNQNIEVNVRGLHEKYEGLYEGDMIEEEMEKMENWNTYFAEFSRDTPPHPEWISTRSVKSTGETFGLIDPVQRLVTDDDSASGSDRSLEECALIAATELDDLEYNSDYDEEVASGTTASGQWMAAQFGRRRPGGRLKGKDEWDFFRENLPRYQNLPGQSQSNEADNYSSVVFSEFADHWNVWVDSLGCSKTQVTYKNATQLQEAFKIMKKRAVEESTMRAHSERVDCLQQNLRDAESNRQFLPEFPSANEPSRKRPALNTIRDIGTQTDQSGQVLATVTHVTTSVPPPPNPVKKKKATYSKQRCRKCGREYSSAQWKDMHIVPKPNGNLRNHDGVRVWDYCTVPVHLYAPNFPCLDLTKRMPPNKSKRKINA